MPDVSRVEYDAALKRVRTVAQCLGDPCPCPCICKSFTLAALGLDEPPTEEEGTPVSDAKAIYENLPPEAVAAAAAFIRGLFYNQGEDYPLDEALAARNCATHILHAAGWVPPAEPPKACPTCEGRGYFDRRGGLQDDCHYCLGTGIDGGTHDG